MPLTSKDFEKYGFELKEEICCAYTEFAAPEYYMEKEDIRIYRNDDKFKIYRGNNRVFLSEIKTKEQLENIFKSLNITN